MILLYTNCTFFKMILIVNMLVIAQKFMSIKMCKYKGVNLFEGCAAKVLPGSLLEQSVETAN